MGHFALGLAATGVQPLKARVRHLPAPQQGESITLSQGIAIIARGPLKALMPDGSRRRFI